VHQHGRLGPLESGRRPSALDVLEVDRLLPGKDHVRRVGVHPRAPVLRPELVHDGGRLARAAAGDLVGEDLAEGDDEEIQVFGPGVFGRRRCVRFAKAEAGDGVGGGALVDRLGLWEVVELLLVGGGTE